MAEPIILCDTEGMTEDELILSEKDMKWGGIEEYKKERNL